MSEYEGLTGADDALNEADSNVRDQQSYYGYGYSDFTQPSDSKTEHGLLPQHESLLLATTCSVILLVDTFMEEGIASTILPLGALIGSVLLILKLKYSDIPISNNVALEQLPNIALFVTSCWLLCVVFLTTSTDYLYLSTGYVAIWLGFLASVNFAAYLVPLVAHGEAQVARLRAKSSSLLLVGVLSLIMFFSSSFSCALTASHRDFCNANSMFSILASLTSVCVSGYLVFSNHTKNTVILGGAGGTEEKAILRKVTLGLFGLWAVVVVMCTTRRPYYNRESGSVVANVFFSSWGCLVITGQMCQALRTANEVQPEVSNNNEGNLYV